MISDYSQFKKNGVTIEANWNKGVTPAKKFKITIDGKSVIIDKQDMFNFLILFGDSKQQMEAINTISTEVRPVHRLLKVRVKKDMRKGEILAFPYTYYVTEGVRDQIQKYT